MYLKINSIRSLSIALLSCLGDTLTLIGFWVLATRLRRAAAVSWHDVFSFGLRSRIAVLWSFVTLVAGKPEFAFRE